MKDKEIVPLDLGCLPLFDKKDLDDFIAHIQFSLLCSPNCCHLAGLCAILTDMDEPQKPARETLEVPKGLYGKDCLNAYLEALGKVHEDCGKPPKDSLPEK